MGRPVEAALGALAPETTNCAHCGLAARTGDLYCCHGCEIAAQIAADGAEEHGKTRAGLIVSLLLSMTVMMLSLFLFSEDVYDIAPGAEMSWLATAYRVAAGVLSAPVVVLLGVPVARRAARLLAAGRLSMDLLIAAGSFAAFGISVYSILAGRRGVYFDSATSALLLATLGRYLEATGRANAARLLGPELRRASEPVLVAGADGFVQRSPSLVVPGDRLRIGVEEVVPVDARLVDGPAEVSLGVLTGESLPVTRQAGDELPAGAIVITGPIECVALRPMRDSTLERLGELAKRLSEQRPGLSLWADRFAALLLPVVLVLALGTLALHAREASVEKGVIAALAVVLAACPCTYGVATPLVFWLALRKALAHGVLVRTAPVLESLSRVRAVAFDKTGTLTESGLSVLRVETAGGVDDAEVLSLLLALEEGTKHPVGRAIAAHARRAGASAAPLRERAFLAGKGSMGADAEGRALLCGSPSWLASCGVVEALVEDASARVVLARAGRVIARVTVGEVVRPEAKGVLAALAGQGIAAFMLTGDGSKGATETAASLGLPAHTGLSAEDKVRALERSGGTVAMVGDGLNDAPALAGTRPSFAVHGGTDLARGMAQVALLRPDLRLVPWTIALAKRACTIARTNLIASTVYNLVFLSLAAAGALRPVWAGLSMATSSLLVLASASRVGAFRGPEGEEPS